MKTAAKVFIIISLVLAGIAAFTGLGLIYSIPCFIIGIITFKKLDTATSKNELTGWAIATLILVNLIAGILILCMKDEDLQNGTSRRYVDDIESLDKRLEELGKLRQNGTISEEEYQQIRKRILGGDM